MKFRASVCDPLKPEIIEIGDIPEEKIIEFFEQFSWVEHLQNMLEMEGDPFYSPSIEVQNKETKHGLAISAAGEPDNYWFMIFYKRPKKLKSFFGLKETMDDNYLTDIDQQTAEDAVDCLNALIKGDTAFLENKIGE